MLKIYPVLFAALLLPAIHSCRPANKADKDTLVIIDGSPLKKGAAVSYEALATSVLGDLLYSPIVYGESVDGRTIIHKILAEDVRVRQGNRTIEVRLRDSIRFHDGKELTSYDMVAAVEYIKKAQNDLYGSLYKNLAVEIIDRKSFRMTNGTPIFDIEYFLNNLYVFIPLSSGTPVGTGPFRFSRWLDDGVELAANENYFEGRPGIKKVRYIYEEDERKRLARLLRQEADIMIFISPEVAQFLEKDNRYLVHKKKDNLYSAIFFNNRSLIFRDKAVRRAISLAIDRDVLIEKGLRGSGIKEGGLIRSYNRTAPGPFDYRPKEAVRLLNEAGWRPKSRARLLEKNGRVLRFLLYYDKDKPENKDLIYILSQSLFEVGVEMEGVPIDLNEFNRKHLKGGDFDAVLLTSVRALDYDNYNKWHSSLPEANWTGYSNQEVDKLLEEIRVSEDQESKKRLYAKIGEIFNDEVPAAFLYNNVSYHAVSRRFKGGEGFAGNVYSVYKIKDWSVNEDTR